MKKTILTLTGLFFIAAIPVKAATIYSNDFTSGSTANITGIKNIETAPLNGQRFLGQLGLGSSSTLTLNTAGYNNLVLKFDLLALNSLDGNGTVCCGPDSFMLRVNGVSVLNNTFGNESQRTQNYGATNGATDVAGGTGSDPALTGTLGYNSLGPDHTYHMSFNLAPSATTTIDFIGNSNQTLGDEGFGIDNIAVTGDAAVPEPATWALLLSGFGMIGYALRRSGRRTLSHPLWQG